MPSKWLRVMLGEVIYDSMEEAQEINGLVMRLYNQVNQPLNDKTLKLPAASLDEEQLGDWCHGYLEGSRLDDTWGNGEAALDELLPFCVLSGMFERKAKPTTRATPSKTIPPAEAALPKPFQRWLQKSMTTGLDGVETQCPVPRPANHRSRKSAATNPARAAAARNLRSAAVGE